MGAKVPVVAGYRSDPALACVLKQVRRDRNRTQEDLAHDAGLTAAALARIERANATPSWTTVRRIADALGLSLVELGQAVQQWEEDRAKTSRPKRQEQNA